MSVDCFLINKIVQDPERDVQEMEQWLRYQGDVGLDHIQIRLIRFVLQDTREEGTSTAFNNFLQKRASTIPSNSNSTQQAMYPNLQGNTNL